MFAEIFSTNSNLDDSCIYSSAFTSKINMRLHNIPVTLDLDKKVIIDLDSLNVTWPGCIPVVALKNCEPELSYALAHCNQGPEKSWKVPEFDKCPGLLINFKKCSGLSWNSFIRKSIVVFFQIFYHDWFSVGVYNNVSIVIYMSEENYVQLNVQKEMNKS